MSTKTMRLPPRRVLTATEREKSHNSKRKERKEGFEIPKPKVPKLIQTTMPPQLLPQPGSDPVGPNKRVLAGYLALEFLAQGSLLGKPYEPSRAEPMRKWGSGSSSGGGAEPSGGKEEGKYQKYVEVSSLMKTDGAHLSGIVNPKQVTGRFLQM